jgi:hypothetical protein
LKAEAGTTARQNHIKVKSIDNSARAFIDRVALVRQRPPLRPPPLRAAVCGCRTPKLPEAAVRRALPEQVPAAEGEALLKTN